MSIHNFVFICSVIIGVPVAVYLLVKYKSMLFPPEKGPNPLGYLGLFTFPVILVAMVLELGADIFGNKILYNVYVPSSFGQHIYDKGKYIFYYKDKETGKKVPLKGDLHHVFVNTRGEDMMVVPVAKEGYKGKLPKPWLLPAGSGVGANQKDLFYLYSEDGIEMESVPELIYVLDNAKDFEQHWKDKEFVYRPGGDSSIFSEFLMNLVLEKMIAEKKAKKDSMEKHNKNAGTESSR